MGDRKAGEQLGRWTIRDKIGQGGNADVYEAVDATGARCAIKILRSYKSGSEPLARFRDEIAALQRIGEHPGILPLLDFSLPDNPTRKEPPWLATPLAVGIKEALAEQTLEQGIEAVATIAETLDDLHRTKAVAHRDIKPPNLFSYEGRWVLGDFGLADFPSKEALTEDGKKLGPTFFIAPEMLRDAPKASAVEADVYSLAKTLRVLASGQNYPPQGEQRIDVPSLTLASLIVHPRIRSLDLLIERATRTNPKDRPPMADFARELRAWLSPSGPIVELRDIGAFRDRIDAAVAPAKRQVDERELKITIANETYRRMQRELKALKDEMENAVPEASLVENDQMILDIFGYHAALGEPDRIWARCVTIKVAPTPQESENPITLRCGFALELFADGKVYISGAAMVGTTRRSDQNWDWSFREFAQVGSAVADQTSERCIAELRSNVPASLEKLVRRLEE